jgi:hypothetical protein
MYGCIASKACKKIDRYNQKFGISMGGSDQIFPLAGRKLLPRVDSTAGQLLCIGV